MLGIVRLQRFAPVRIDAEEARCPVEIDPWVIGFPLWKGNFDTVVLARIQRGVNGNLRDHQTSHQ